MGDRLPVIGSRSPTPRLSSACADPGLTAEFTNGCARIRSLCKEDAMVRISRRVAGVQATDPALHPAWTGPGRLATAA